MIDGSPDLWHQPQSSPSRAHAPKSRRRVLRPAEPLSGLGMDAAAFVRHCLTEYRKALHSEGRARHEYRESVKLNAPLAEQHDLEAIMAREQLRLAQIEADLVAWGTRCR